MKIEHFERIRESVFNEISQYEGIIFLRQYDSKQTLIATKLLLADAHMIDRELELLLQGLYHIKNYCEQSAAGTFNYPPTSLENISGPDVYEVCLYNFADDCEEYDIMMGNFSDELNFFIENFDKFNDLQIENQDVDTDDALLILDITYGLDKFKSNMKCVKGILMNRGDVAEVLLHLANQ